jgi:hypothetical protein
VAVTVRGFGIMPSFERSEVSPVLHEICSAIAAKIINAALAKLFLILIITV